MRRLMETMRKRKTEMKLASSLNLRAECVLLRFLFSMSLPQYHHHRQNMFWARANQMFAPIGLFGRVNYVHGVTLLPALN